MSSNSPESSSKLSEASNGARESSQQERIASSPQRNREALAEFSELHAWQDPFDYFHINFNPSNNSAETSPNSSEGS